MSPKEIANQNLANTIIKNMAKKIWKVITVLQALKQWKKPCP